MRAPETGTGVAGRVIVVTGGGGGLGREYSAELAAEGAVVVVADVDVAAAEAVATQLISAGGRAIAVAVDVSDPESVEQMMAAVTNRFDRLDGLVNNAALMTELPRGAFENISPEAWDRVMAVNLRGPFLLCRAAVPLMRRRNYGKIVNISSTRVFEGTAGRLHYTTSKAGILGFTRALAREVGADGITVNSVAPGLTVSARQRATSSEEYLRQTSAGRAIDRAATPTDIVGAVTFLLGPGSDFITGQCIVVDGGKVMR